MQNNGVGKLLAKSNINEECKTASRKAFKDEYAKHIFVVMEPLLTTERRILEGTFIYHFQSICYLNSALGKTLFSTIEIIFVDTMDILISSL